MRSIIFLAIAILTTLNAQSQTTEAPAQFHWQQLGVLPNFGTLKCFQIHNGNTLVALVRDGFSKPQFCYSTDFGKTWNKNDLPPMDWSWSQLFSQGNRLTLIPCQNCEPTQYISTDLGKNWTLYSDKIAGTEGLINYLDYNTRYKHFGYDYTIYEYENGQWNTAYSGKAESQWSAPAVYVGLRDICYGSIENSPFVNIRYYFQGVTGFFTGKPGMPIYCCKSVMVQSKNWYYNVRNNLLISTDNGKNWEIAHESPADAGTNSLEMKQLFRVCENGKLFADFTRGVRDAKGALYEVADFCFSNDQGRAWISLSAPGRQHTKEILFMPDGSIVAITTENNIFKSSLAVGCSYDAGGKNCKYPTFDEGKPIVTGTGGGGFVIEGSEDFTKLVAKALLKLKSTSPDLYEKYIFSPTYNGLKGIKIDCEFGVNHPDEAMFIQLSIKTNKNYNDYNDCIELLSSVILHEAVHVYQANEFMKRTGGNFRDFCQDNRKNLETAQRHEREPLAIQTQYLEKAFKDCPCQQRLRQHWCWIINLYKSDYPDADHDGEFTSKDNANWASGTHPEISENCPDDNVVTKSFVYESEINPAETTGQNGNDIAARVIQETEVNSQAPTGLSNGSFTNSQDWGIVNGSVTYNGGMASIKPQKSNQPAILKHQPFQIPQNAQTLRFKMDKSRMGDADLKVILRDQINNEAKVVYSDQIRQGIDKINKGLDAVNKVLNNGEINTTHQQTNFESVLVDISNFSGRTVTLEISIETLGMFKPKILMDDFEIQ